jgi:hypothetical protein
VYNGRHYSKSILGQIILVGNDTTGAGNDKHDGAEIYGNTIYGPLYYDRTLNSVGLHSIEFAWSKQAKIHHNYVNGGGYGLAIKGGAHDWAGVGGAYFNEIVDIGGTGATNPSQGGIFVKGAQNVPVYNNTVSLAATYKQQYGLIRVYTNNDVGTHLAGSAIIKNNLLVADSGQNLIYVGLAGDAADNASITADYNLYYSRGGDFNASVGAATTYTTWAGWQAAGYDAHSPTPADPQFVSTTDFRLRPASPAIGAGADLSATIGTTGADGLPITNTDGTWPIGAYGIMYKKKVF